ERNISLGQSDTAYAWTDGKAAIAFDRNFVKSSFKDGVDGILRLLAVWVHEYLHDEPDSDAHNHSPEFLDAFEQVMTSRSYAPFTTAQRILKRVEVEAKKSGKRLNKPTMDALDATETIQGAELVLLHPDGLT